MTTLTDVSAGTGPRHVDLGRLVMIPVGIGFIALKVSNVVAVGVGTPAAALSASGAVLSGAFYALVVAAYLRRSPAKATSTSLTSHVAAIAGSWLILVLPFLPHRSGGAVLSMCSQALLLAGLAWSVWSIATLGRSFSVLAQARSIVTSGPYRFVRHPVYFGELLGALGLALGAWGWPAAAVWLSILAFQLTRTVHEERVLSAALDGYTDYRSRTKRLVPGLL